MVVNAKLLTAQIGFMFLVFAAALFFAAGTVAWVSGWIYLSLFFVFVVAVTTWLYKHDPGLLQERMTLFKPDQEPWDKALIIFVQVFFYAWLIIMPLDAVRFRWSHMPVWLQFAGAIILLCSFYLLFLPFRENPYLSPAVRIQKERGHTVISTGPYRYVRHPLYAAVIPFVLGTALLLGSWYGVLSGLVQVVIIARRAVLEERLLRKELEGYDHYMDQVKYRLIPHVW